MIDLKHEARNFAPMDLKGLLDEENDFNEDIRWSYSLYNKALSFIKKGYDDMARQNLKKALGLNPDFYPARMLLGVCLFSNGDRVGAMRMFNTIRDIQYKKLAMSYYDYLTEEVDKPVSQSGSRLILKDLYRAAAGSQKNVADVTRVQPINENDLPPKQNKGPVTTGTELEDRKPVRAQNVASGTEKTEKEQPPLNAPSEESPSDEPYERDSLPGGDRGTELNVITSRKNDGVVEEIIRKKMEDAQNTAIRTGSRKKPFAFSNIYSKPVFGETRPSETVENRETSQEPAPVREKKDNIVIAVMSVFVLLFLVTLSIFLMSQISENRKLKNDLDSMKKLYAEATVTEAPSPVPTFPSATEIPTQGNDAMTSAFPDE